MHSFGPLVRRLVYVAAVALAAVTLAGPTTSATGRDSTQPGCGSPGTGGAYPYRDPGLPIKQRVQDLLSRMTLAEKIGQMTQAERASVDTTDPSKITTDNLGSVLSGGGSVPTPNTPRAWADMVDRYQQAALATRCHIPLIYGIDTVHGDGNMYGATVFPHNIGLGASRDPELVRAVEHVAAQETRTTGPQWAFAPCVCVARDDRWGRTYESFGEDPSLVRTMEAAAIEGFQGSPGDLSNPDRVLATAKHFAGDGLTTYGTGSNMGTTGNYPIDQGVDQVDHATFNRLALSPYVTAVREHVGAVMPSYSDVQFTDTPGSPRINMHANRDLITGWLKGAMGFDGFVISDYNGIDHINPGPNTTFAQRVEAGVNAGIDMFMQPQNFEQFEATLTNLVNSGQVPMSRIDDAVSRILTAKFKLGLFEHPFTDRRYLDQVGSPAHHALARRAAAESQVLLKNQHEVLPIQGHDIYVAGSNADNIGNQAGGWTLTWQGGSTNVIPGTTILDGIRRLARGDVTYSQDASAPIPHGAIGIVVVGETPYSEGFGDVFGPRWAYDPGDHGVMRPVKDMQLSAADKAAVDRVCAAARRCVMVIVSGRPLILDPAQRNEADAIVAAWLPGSEGAGVADTLFGAVPFTGKLPMSWPRTLAQEPINVGDPHYDPLYPYGYGLTTHVGHEPRSGR